MPTSQKQKWIVGLLSLTCIAIAIWYVARRLAESKEWNRRAVVEQRRSPETNAVVGIPTNTAAGVDQQRLERVIGSKNQPIRLHAIVVDQFSNAVAQAKVSGDITRWRVLPPLMFGSTMDEWSAKTDRNGRLDYFGGFGSLIAIKTIQKEGEELWFAQPNFVMFRPDVVPGETVPTKEQPLVMSVWRVQGRSPMAESSYNTDLPLNTEIYFDVVSGQVATQQLARTDFKISIRSSVNGKKDRSGFIIGKIDSLEIIPLDGMIAEANDQWLLQAPEAGYSNKVWRTEPRAYKTHPWAKWHVPYYYFVRGRFYGSLIMTIKDPAEIRGSNRIRIEIESRLAANGSRNLLKDDLLSDKLNQLEQTKLSIESYRGRAVKEF